MACKDTRQLGYLKNQLLPFESLPPELQTTIITQCNSEECQAAKAEFEKARNAVLRACENLAIAYAKLIRLLLQALALAILIVGFVLAAAAVFSIPILGQIIATVLLGIAAVMAVALLIVLGMISNQNLLVGDAQRSLADARDKFDLAVAGVLEHCSDNCYGDLSQPIC